MLGWEVYHDGAGAAWASELELVVERPLLVQGCKCCWSHSGEMSEASCGEVIVVVHVLGPAKLLSVSSITQPSSRPGRALRPWPGLCSSWLSHWRTRNIRVLPAPQELDHIPQALNMALSRILPSIMTSSPFILASCDCHGIVITVYQAVLHI